MARRVSDNLDRKLSKYAWAARDILTRSPQVLNGYGLNPPQEGLLMNLKDICQQLYQAGTRPQNIARMAAVRWIDNR